jgi:hypothetical protein
LRSSLLLSAAEDHLFAVVLANLKEQQVSGRDKKTPKLVENGTYDYLDLAESQIEQLPNGIAVRFQLNLQNCRRLRRLPAGLKAGSLNLAGCTALEELPEEFSTSFLDLSGCAQIDRWPEAATLAIGRLRARNCLGLTGLPPWLGRLSQLDLAGCANIAELPDGLEVSSWIDLAGTQITSLPESLQGVALRWRGVMIDARIAFWPDQISAREVLDEPNAELRRVKLERMGFERFLMEANPKILDSDTDRGGERRLFHVELSDDEPLVCVSVGCPSTGRRYLIRVPPEIKTCRQAVAWTAGFDDADHYNPLVET